MAVFRLLVQCALLCSVGLVIGAFLGIGRFERAVGGRQADGQCRGIHPDDTMYCAGQPDGLVALPVAIDHAAEVHLAAVGLATVVLMSATNFALDSDFKWILLMPALLWLSALAVYAWRR